MGYAKYIGRVGTLAVALGVGAAVASQPGIAWAEESSTESNTAPPPSPSTDESAGGQHEPAPQSISSSQTDPDPDPDPPAEQTNPSGNVTTIDNGSGPTVVISSSGGAHTSDEEPPTEVDPPTDEQEDPLDTDAAPPADEPAPPQKTSPAANFSTPAPSKNPPPTSTPEPAPAPVTATSVPDDPPAPVERSVRVDTPAHNTLRAVSEEKLSAPQEFSTFAAEPAEPAPVALPRPSFIDTVLAVPAALIAGVVNVVLNFVQPLVAPNGPLENAALFGLLAWTRRQVNQTFANRAPELGQDISLTVDEDSTDNVIGALPATDADGDAIAYSVHPDHGPSNGTVTIVGNEVTYTPNAGYAGTDTFALVGSDAAGGFHVHALGATHRDAVRVTVTIRPDGENDAPVANPDTATVAEGGTVVVNVIANDTDTDGTIDPTSVTVGTALNGTATANPDGTVTFTHDGGETTTASFTYTVEDNDGAVSNTATVTFSVTPVDDAPVAVADTATTPAGTPVTIDVLANDTDVDGGPKAVVGVLQPAAGGSVSIPVGGTAVEFTPDDGFTGQTSFTYTLNGGSSATVTVTVTGDQLNNPPTVEPEFGDPDPATGLVTGNLNARDDLLSPEQLTYTVLTAPDGLEVADDGSFTYTPTAMERIRAALSGQTETVSFTVSVSDGVNAPVIVTVPGIAVGPGMYVQTDAAPIDGDLPVELAFNGKHIYATNGADSRILVYNTDTGEFEEPIEVDGVPTALTISNGTLYATLQAAEAVTEFDLDTLERGQTWPAGTYPGLVVAANGKLYVSNIMSNTITVTDLADPPSGEPDQFTLPGQARGIAIVGDKLYATSAAEDFQDSGHVTIIDIASGVAGEPIEVGINPTFLNAANGKVYVVNSSSLTVSVLEDGELVDTIDSGIPMGDAIFYGSTVSPDGTTLILTALGFGGDYIGATPLVIIDTGTDQVVHIVDETPGLLWVEFGPDGTLYGGGLDENGESALLTFELLAPDIDL
ncbi:Ig-like domain-containing protein [Mycolicibacterium phlei]